MGTAPHAIDSILRAVGRTPLVRLERFERPDGPRLFAKCEFLGPGNSIFDRPAVAALLSAQRGGHLADGRAVITVGGGDWTISLAMVCSASGHPLTVVVPRSLNVERKTALTDYGAKLMPVDDELGMEGAVRQALALLREIHALGIGLFDGPEVVASYEKIGEEIVESLEHVPAITVCGLDLGAIPTGVARGLKGTVVAVEPATARIATRGTFAPHLIGGLAPAAEPTALDRELVKEFEAVEDADAWAMADRLSREAGLLAGIASGAVMVAALRRAATLRQGDVVAVLPDSGERRFMLAGFFR